VIIKLNSARKPVVNLYEANNKHLFHNDYYLYSERGRHERLSVVDSLNQCLLSKKVDVPSRQQSPRSTATSQSNVPFSSMTSRLSSPAITRTHGFGVPVHFTNSMVARELNAGPRPMTSGKFINVDREGPNELPRKTKSISNMGIIYNARQVGMNTSNSFLMTQHSGMRLRAI